MSLAGARAAGVASPAALLLVVALACRTGPSEQAPAGPAPADAAPPAAAELSVGPGATGGAPPAAEAAVLAAGTGASAGPAAASSLAGGTGAGEATATGGAAALPAGAGAMSAGTEPPPPGAPAPLPCLEPPPPGMACVPAGWFTRGSDDGPENARPAARVWLQTYYMDIHEVTYAEYKACAKARQCDPKGGPAYTDFDRPKQPVNGVSWFHAEGYCKAKGKRLPSEAQWEKAARGPDGELHPWGDEPATCERAIIKDERGRSCGVKKLYSKPETGRPWEIGSRPVGRYGLYDMSGNSWEWVSDWYSRSYAECGADCLGVDPLGPCAGAPECPGKARKLVRGGSWYWDASYATGIWRRPHVPSNQPFHHFGFRCAASPTEAEALARAGG